MKAFLKWWEFCELVFLRQTPRKTSSAVPTKKPSYEGFLLNGGSFANWFFFGKRLEKPLLLFPQKSPHMRAFLKWWEFCELVFLRQTPRKTSSAAPAKKAFI